MLSDQIEEEARVYRTARVPMIRPSSGVLPMEVQTLRPWETAHTEEPPPRCARTSETSSAPVCSKAAARGTAETRRRGRGSRSAADPNSPPTLGAGRTCAPHWACRRERRCPPRRREERRATAGAARPTSVTRAGHGGGRVRRPFQRLDDGIVHQGRFGDRASATVHNAIADGAKASDLVSERRQESIGLGRPGRGLHRLLPGPFAGGADENEPEAVGPGVNHQHISHAGFAPVSACRDLISELGIECHRCLAAPDMVEGRRCNERENCAHTGPSRCESVCVEDPMEDLSALNMYFRAANYLTVGEIYLMANPLLRRPLDPEDIKPRLLGHWGTSPGLNLLYAHLNRVIRQRDLNALFICGPGHGGPAMVANTWLEGSYTERYPHVSRNEEGIARLFRQFSFPGGIPSHCSPETPGVDP